MSAVAFTALTGTPTPTAPAVSSLHVGGATAFACTSSNWLRHRSAAFEIATQADAVFVGALVHWVFSATAGYGSFAPIIRSVPRQMERNSFILFSMWIPTGHAKWHKCVTNGRAVAGALGRTIFFSQWLSLFFFFSKQRQVRSTPRF